MTDFQTLFPMLTEGERRMLVRVIEECVRELPERGFGFPKEGTPAFQEGTFTKHISAEETVVALKQLILGEE